MMQPSSSPAWGLARPRRPFRLHLWLPLSLFCALLLPLAMIGFPLLAVAAMGLRLRPVALFCGVFALLFALSGVVVEVDTPDTSIRIRLF